jgi:hypothetical protein
MGWLPEHKKGEVIKDYYSRIKDQYLWSVIQKQG